MVTLNFTTILLNFVCQSQFIDKTIDITSSVHFLKMFPRVEDMNPYEAPICYQAPIVEDLDSDSDVKAIKDQLEWEQQNLANIQKRIDNFKITDYSDNSTDFDQFDILQDMKDDHVESIENLKKQLSKISFKNLVIKKPTEVSTFNQEIRFDLNEPIKKDKSIHKKEKLKRQSDVAYKPKIINICNNYNSFVQLNIRL